MEMQAHAVLYGIGSGLESRPNFLEKEHWRLVANVAKDKPQAVCPLLLWCAHCLWSLEQFQILCFCREMSL